MAVLPTLSKNDARHKSRHEPYPRPTPLKTTKSFTDLGSAFEEWSRFNKGQHLPIPNSPSPPAAPALSLRRALDIIEKDVVISELVFRTPRGQTFRLSDTDTRLQLVSSTLIHGGAPKDIGHLNPYQADSKPEASTAIQDGYTKCQSSSPGGSQAGTDPALPPTIPQEVDGESKIKDWLDEETLESEAESANIEAEKQEFRGFIYERRQIRVDEIGDYYPVWFTYLQQKACKKILQTWIKRAHPKKQAQNPYNGKGRAKAKTQADRDAPNPGEDTAPHYWPNQSGYGTIDSGDARHKEPDHIRKHERLNLLVHFLRLDKCGCHDWGDVNVLEESTRNILVTHPDHFQPRAALLLKQVYDARRKEIEWARGECDDDTMISVYVPVKPQGKAKKPARIFKASKQRRARNLAKENDRLVGSPENDGCIDSIQKSLLVKEETQGPQRDNIWKQAVSPESSHGSSSAHPQTDDKIMPLQISNYNPTSPASEVDFQESYLDTDRFSDLVSDLVRGTSPTYLASTTSQPMDDVRHAVMTPVSGPNVMVPVAHNLAKHEVESGRLHHHGLPSANYLGDSMLDHLERADHQARIAPNDAYLTSSSNALGDRGDVMFSRLSIENLPNERVNLSYGPELAPSLSAAPEPTPAHSLVTQSQPFASYPSNTSASQGTPIGSDHDCLNADFWFRFYQSHGPGLPEIDAENMQAIPNSGAAFPLNQTLGPEWNTLHYGQMGSEQYHLPMLPFAESLGMDDAEQQFGASQPMRRESISSSMQAMQAMQAQNRR